MSLLTETIVERRARQAPEFRTKSARQILTEARVGPDREFDIFLSHSSAEKEILLLGVKLILEDQGYSVYVDKYSDPHLSPDRVTETTAETLRQRMRCSQSLLYMHSVYSGRSRWMPWELGFFDGCNGSVGILPVARRPANSFRGEEYLGLYPYVDLASTTRSARRILWVNSTSGAATSFDRWLVDPRPQ